MLRQKTAESVLKAIEASPSGVAMLDVLESLKLCGRDTLKTTISRLNKAGRIIRLKRGTYSTNPMDDAYACCRATFGGYLGFASALHIHGLITENPFTVHVVTPNLSKTVKIGQYEFKAVAMKEKAIGFERKGNYVVSTRAKTLFDCLYLPEYGVEKEKLRSAYANAKLTGNEWKEFKRYAGMTGAGKRKKMMDEAKRVKRHGTEH